MALHGIEELARAELVFAIGHGPTRIQGPLLARTHFLFSQTAHPVKF
jgi:hypothetical protein